MCSWCTLKDIYLLHFYCFFLSTCSLSLQLSFIDLSGKYSLHSHAIIKMSADHLARDTNSIEHEESSIYACFALQSKIFVGQVNEIIALDKVLSSHAEEIKMTNASVTMPNFFNNKLSDDHVDDFEILMLGKLS